MSEEEAERVFFEIVKNEIEPNLGRGETNSFELDAVGEKLFGPEWGGVHASDRIRRPSEEKTEYSIGNVDTSNMPGSHWLAFYKERGKPTLIYDSFGRESGVLIPQVVKVLEKWIDADPDAEQFNFESRCGQLCLGFLLFAKRFGYDNAKLI